jgi:hypothetical protein
MKYDDILAIIDNKNDIDNDLYKEKQQLLYSLIKHDAIQIIYQPKTDEDIFKLHNDSQRRYTYYDT